MGYGSSMYAAKAEPVGPIVEPEEVETTIEDAVMTAINDGAETYEELYASINANSEITGYDVDEVGDLFDEFIADKASDGYA